MAKTTKSIKNAPLRNGSGTDQTFLTEYYATLAFNRACNVRIKINTEALTIAVMMNDEVSGKNYAGLITLEEV